MSSSSLSWVYPVVLLALIGLVAQSNQKLWQLQNTQKSFSRLVVDQLKTTVDSIDEIQQKISKQNDVLVIQPSVIRDSWNYAPQWISFVQNSSLLVLQKTQELYKTIIDAVDPDLTQILTIEMSNDERISLALRWSQKEDTLHRNAIVEAIRKSADFGRPESTKNVPKIVPKIIETQIEVQTKPTTEPVQEVVKDVVQEAVKDVVLEESVKEAVQEESVQQETIQEVFETKPEEVRRKAPKRKGPRNAVKESSESSLTL